MTLIGLIIAIAIVGFVCWLVLQIPMPAPFPKIIIAVVCFVFVLWLLQALGLATGLPNLRIK